MDMFLLPNTVKEEYDWCFLSIDSSDLLIIIREFSFFKSKGNLRLTFDSLTKYECLKMQPFSGALTDHFSYLMHHEALTFDPQHNKLHVIFPKWFAAGKLFHVSHCAGIFERSE